LIEIKKNETKKKVEWSLFSKKIYKLYVGK
jgi:hypothetical protein